MNTKELLEKYEGVTSRLHTLFNYHIDAIIRESKMELCRLEYAEYNQIMNDIHDYIEESFCNLCTLSDFINTISNKPNK